MKARTVQRRFVLHVAAVVVVTCALAGCGQSQLPFKSVDITGAEYAKSFQLTDHLGQVRQLEDFRGRLVVVFFGFTQCPDVCPTALADLAEVKRLLGPQGDKLQGIFVSVDPERDSPEVLKAYMANFDPAFIALRPSMEQLPEVAKGFKVFYKKVEGPTPTSYTIEHSAGSYVFDPQGRVRLYTRQAVGAQGLAEDLALLLK